MNREVVLPGGAGIYPLMGDVTSTAGSPRVTVTGLQGISIATSFPITGQLLEYNASTNSYQAVVQPGIQVNGFNSSGDYILSVNVPIPVEVNGS